MLHPKNIKVTRFSNIKNVDDSETILLFKEIKDIKTGVYKNQILACREAISNNDQLLYNRLKISLPAVTFGGTFKSGRKISNLDTYNNLMIIDVDKLEIKKLNSLREQLLKNPYVLSLWKSPSGNGFKFLVRIDSSKENHKLIFNSLKDYFENEYDFKIDNSGSDVSRLCYSSWDEDLFYNSKALIFNLESHPKIDVNSNDKSFSRNSRFLVF